MTIKHWYTSSSGNIEIEMTLAQARSASHQGQCSADVRALSKDPEIKKQLDEIDPSQLYAELAEYGAWDEVELQDHAENLQRILWLAASDIVEEHTGEAE
jgi:hypothetical protein